MAGTIVGQQEVVDQLLICLFARGHCILERQVSSGGKRYALPDPFFVLATQNPIEQEGTYPLPEAQLDRFLMKVFVGYPSGAEERTIYRVTTADQQSDPTPVLGAEELLNLQSVVRRVPASDFCVDY